MNEPREDPSAGHRGAGPAGDARPGGRPGLASPTLPTGAGAPPRAARRRSALDVAILTTALLLALVPAGAFVARLARGTPPTTKPFLFPASERAAFDALRDRAAKGLLVLQQPGGGFLPRLDAVEVDPLDRAEATAIGLAGLAVASRLGSRVEGLEDGLAKARRTLTQLQSQSGQFGVSRRPRRGVGVSAVACGVIGLCVAGEAGDLPYLESAGRALVAQAQMGTLPSGWVQAAAARGLAQLVESGYGGWLGDDPVSVLPSQRIELSKRVTDSHVAQALVLQIQTALGAPPVDLPKAVLKRLLDDPPTWTGLESDMGSWVQQAWLAARLPDGPAWFENALAELAKAPGETGVVEGDYYGYPVARTAGVLLVLWEGGGRRPIGAP